MEEDTGDEGPTRISGWKGKEAGKERPKDLGLDEQRQGGEEEVDGFFFFFFFISILAYGLYHGESPWLRKAT